MTSQPVPGPANGAQTNWARWGADDRNGTLNLIDDEKVLQALRLPEAGRRFEVGHLVAANEPVQKHKQRAALSPVTRHNDRTGRGSLDGELRMPIHSGTHLDALSHYWTGPELFNGVRRDEVIAGEDTSLSVTQTPPIITRAVLVDLASKFTLGSSSWSKVITVADLQWGIARSGCSLEPGDAVLIRTGWSQVWRDDPKCYLWGEPGIGIDAARWLADQDVALVGADNWAIEAIPPEQVGQGLPVHDMLLGRFGIHLLENLCLDELADTAGPGAYLLILMPLRIVGASGSPVRPVVVA